MPGRLKKSSMGVQPLAVAKSTRSRGITIVCADAGLENKGNNKKHVVNAAERRCWDDVISLLLQRQPRIENVPGLASVWDCFRPDAFLRSKGARRQRLWTPVPEKRDYRNMALAVSGFSK
jgi:hypothetical protein